MSGCLKCCFEDKQELEGQIGNTSYNNAGDPIENACDMNRDLETALTKHRQRSNRAGSGKSCWYTAGPICRREILGGVIHDYYRLPLRFLAMDRIAEPYWILMVLVL